MLDRSQVVDSLLVLTRQFALPARDALARSAPLRESGLTSMAAVRLMLSIEAAFAIAIPDAELTPENFVTTDSIEALIRRMRAD
ncbi:MAG: phosphopantetheine-binding protein [Roseiarcus sp.]